VGNTGTANAAGAGFNITVGAGMSGSYAFTASSNNVVLDVISDARLKKDVLQETLGLAFINALKPVTYRMINGTEMLHHGFIAQDVETVLGKGDDSLTVENAEGIKGLNYTALIGPMAKAIQELTIRIAALETP
jgi:exoribonuclease II